MPDTTARLREAAYALFEQQGYAATTVDQIAARAGVGGRESETGGENQRGGTRRTAGKGGAPPPSPAKEAHKRR